MSEIIRKQYLVMIDEVGMALLSNLSPKFQFLEVQGFNMQGQEAYQFLVTPMKAVESSGVVAEKVEG